MFRWQKEMQRLEVPAEQVLGLHRSLNAVQLGLPGFPSQEADAFLCLFASGRGIRAAVVLHLLVSNRLAVFLNEEGEVGRQSASRLVQAGLDFAESMGFMLGELDWACLAEHRQSELWSQLRLQTGPGSVRKAVADPPTRPSSPPSSGKSPPRQSEPVPPPEPPSQGAEFQQQLSIAAKEPVAKSSEPARNAPAAPAAAAAEEPSVDEPSAPTSPKQQKRRPPTDEEMSQRRQKFRESLGRFLASL